MSFLHLNMHEIHFSTEILGAVSFYWRNPADKHFFWISFFRRFHANFKALCHLPKMIWFAIPRYCWTKYFLLFYWQHRQILFKVKKKTSNEIRKRWVCAKRSSMNIIIPRQNRNKHCNYAYARNLIHAYANVFVQIKAESACAISWTNPEKSNNNNDGRSNDSDRSSSSITNAEITQTHLFA